MSLTLIENPAPSWQKSLGLALRTAEDLVNWGFIAPHETEIYRDILSTYSSLLPTYYASLIDRDDPLCPIRLQAVPSPLEKIPFGKGDPLADLDHRPAPRITHRYPSRALLHLTPNCSMYCRFCFRKTLLNAESDSFFEGGLQESLDYLRHHPEIEEVILSGGDPLMASDPNLKWTFKQISSIPSVKRVRVHSRVPVTFPERITAGLVEALGSEKPVVLVTHFNHPKELTPACREAVARLKQSGVTVLNQSVLLKKVNDRVETLQQLMEGLFEFGILPYYLHHPDQAAGTAHFQLSYDEGLNLYETLKKRLPGYLVPRYVVDEGDAHYKRDVRRGEEYR